VKDVMGIHQQDANYQLFQIPMDKKEAMKKIYRWLYR
jgi:hypothetical protein